MTPIVSLGSILTRACAEARRRTHNTKRVTAFEDGLFKRPFPAPRHPEYGRTGAGRNARRAWICLWMQAEICGRAVGRLTVRHSCSSASRSSAAQRTAACCSVSIDIGAQGLLELRLPGHGALHRQHLLPGARAEGDAASTRRRLQRPERAGLVRIAAVVGHVGRTLLFDQHLPTGEQPHQSGDDPVQHRLQRHVARRGGFDELQRAVGTAPVHAVQHRAMQMRVEVAPCCCTRRYSLVCSGRWRA